ncbi:hypothetical protein C8J56DRAFT_792695, partial [Mycena floridula]
IAYVGTDYPLEHPVAGELEYVAMAIQDTSRYQLDGPPHMDDWETLKESILTSRVREGPEHRVFNPSFWHQQHCLRRLAFAISQEDHRNSTSHHVLHCLHYLRQHFLCEADFRLETGDFMDRFKDPSANRVRADTIVCRDWERVFQYLDSSAQEWMDFKMERTKESSDT